MSTDKQKVGSVHYEGSPVGKGQGYEAQPATNDSSPKPSNYMKGTDATNWEHKRASQRGYGNLKLDPNIEPWQPHKNFLNPHAKAMNDDSWEQGSGPSSMYEFEAPHFNKTGAVLSRHAYTEAVYKPSWKNKVYPKSVGVVQQLDTGQRATKLKLYVHSGVEEEPPKTYMEKFVKGVRHFLGFKDVSKPKVGRLEDILYTEKAANDDREAAHDKSFRIAAGRH
jgi:hypothetical protein